MSFWNGYADCGYTATMAENMWIQHYKIMNLVSR
jgi:hypothetical protein